MSNLPVTEMILYKHGVGFFKREEKVKSDEVLTELEGSRA